MPRRKTYLSPEQQYAATFSLYWRKGMRQEAAQFGPSEKAIAEHWLSKSPRLGSFPYFAIVQRPHRLFVPGDLVLYTINNGCADRYPVWSVSSKGYEVSFYYMLFYRWNRGKQSPSGLLKPIWRPGDLAETDDPVCRYQLDHPAAQSYLADLMARETLPLK
jgi:hypothetical protein